MTRRLVAPDNVLFELTGWPGDRARRQKRVTSFKGQPASARLFDATYFRKGLVAHAEASGSGATVEIHLVNGHAHRVRSVVEASDGYVVLEVYQRRPETSQMQAHWYGAAPPPASPNEVHHAVINYESITELVITPAEDKASARIGFSARV